MPRCPRAQIFQSFDALKGFREILKEQETIQVPKRILSEYDLDQLDYTVKQIKPGMMLCIEYRQDNQYIQLTGKVSKIDLDSKFLQIVKTKINLLSITNIEILKEN